MMIPGAPPPYGLTFTWLSMLAQNCSADWWGGRAPGMSVPWEVMSHPVLLPPSARPGTLTPSDTQRRSTVLVDI